MLMLDTIASNKFCTFKMSSKGRSMTKVDKTGASKMSEINGATATRNRLCTRAHFKNIKQQQQNKQEKQIVDQQQKKRRNQRPKKIKHQSQNSNKLKQQKKQKKGQITKKQAKKQIIKQKKQSPSNRCTGKEELPMKLNGERLYFATYMTMARTSKLEKLILLLCSMIRTRTSTLTFADYMRCDERARKRVRESIAPTSQLSRPAAANDVTKRCRWSSSPDDDNASDNGVGTSNGSSGGGIAGRVRRRYYLRKQALQAAMAPPMILRVEPSTVHLCISAPKKCANPLLNCGETGNGADSAVNKSNGVTADNVAVWPIVGGGAVDMFAGCKYPEICEMLYKEDMNELVRNITREAKALVQAEICSLFLLDKEHSELVAEVFEKNGTSDEYLTEIRMPLNQGIVGHVATTGQMLNVRNVNENPYFYKKVDEMTGFTTRNILCFPIKDEKGNLVGVAELCNKIGRKAFTRQDEQCAATFSVYCALSISHCLLYRKLQEAHRRSHMAAELLVQGSTLSIAPEDILRLTVRDIPSPTSFHPEFNHFSFVPRSIGTGDTYVEASLSMFKDLGFIDRYRLRRRTLARFLLMVQKGYRDVPYHNWSHAFAVGHFCYLLIRIPAIMSALTDLERFALLVACLCHDIDHRGTTNAFQLQSRTPLAQLYSSEGSVLERHHFAQTVTILGMEECNIFDQLTRSQYQQVLDHIREIILATDIAAHLRKVRDMRKMVENPDGYNRHSMEHRYLLTCLLMTASDLSDQSKDFKNSKAIAENIYKEFFSQGDLEKQMGNEPNVMMDRDRACVPKIQLHFMDTVALPVFEFAAQLLPELRSTYDSMLMNCVCWQELEAILQEEGHASGGLDYLHDAELERKVFSRLSQRNDLHGQVKALIPRNLPVSAPFTAAEAEAYMRARHSDAVTLANAAAAVAGADVGNNNNNNKNNYSTPTSARSAVTSVSSRLSMTSSFLPSTSADLSPSTSRSTCEQTSKSEDVSAKSSKS